MRILYTSFIFIAISEYLDQKRLQVTVNIFATDIDGRAINKARRGIYSPTIAAQVSPERLERFFVPLDGDYQVNEAVRQMVVFAVQSVVKDPPFSHLDLVSCRNFLIYLEPELQRAVLAVLAYGLKPGGYLLLGVSETPMQSPPHFEVVDRKWRIFRRLQGRADLDAVPLVPGAGRAPTGLSPRSDAARQEVAHRSIERFLLEHHLPPCLVVDREGHILFTYGPTGRYLEPAAGQAGVWHVVRLMRHALRMPLATAIRRAAAEGRPVRVEDLRFELEGRHETTDISVIPLYQATALRGLFLVLFEKPRPPREVEAAPPTPATKGAGRRREAELERDLQDTSESLQTTVEELQSANEELVTAQEEAQSVNEELVTLNTELNTRVDELRVANADLTNLLAAADVGILFLDREFHVRRFNRAAADVVNLIASDVGRPISHISSRLPQLDWLTAAKGVLQNMLPSTLEASRDDGRHYSIHIKAYETGEGAVNGIVVTFTDITLFKRMEQELRRSQIGELVETVHEPLLVLEADLRVWRANRAFYRAFHVTPQETERQLLYELGNHQWDIPRLRELLETIIPRDAAFEGFEVDHEFEGIGRRHMVLNARRLDTRDKGPDLILLAMQERATGGKR